MRVLLSLALLCFSAPLPADVDTLQLQPGQDIVLNQGDNVARNLSVLFTRDYVVFDFAQSGCGPCLSQMASHNSDASFQSRFAAGSKCHFMSIVSGSDLSLWTTRVGRTSWGAKNSYATTNSTIVQAAANLGYSLSATPTTIIMDRDGNIIDSSVGGTPTAVYSLCPTTL